jgi:mannitol/fructose-specific phosphotransferase system IIA component (Ntr-type)
MIRLRAALRPEHIVLDLNAATLADAIPRLAEPLRGDPRVAAWLELVEAWDARARTPGVHLKYGVVLVHARTKAVVDFVMAFGRLQTPVVEHGEPIRFILLIGIPTAMDAEYARLVGVLMRVLRDERLCGGFLEAKRPEEVLAILERGKEAPAP